MWLIPFSYGESHILNITFNKPQTIAGLRIWNYNKSPEDSYRGVRLLTLEIQIFILMVVTRWWPESWTFNVCTHIRLCKMKHVNLFVQVKMMHVFLDDVAISPSEGFLIRKGTGNCHFDFAQEILFVDFLQTPTDNKSNEDFHRWSTKKDCYYLFI